MSVCLSSCFLHTFSLWGIAEFLQQSWKQWMIVVSCCTSLVHLVTCISHEMQTCTTLELEQGSLRDMLYIIHLMQWQSSFPLLCRGEDHHHSTPESCKELQLVTECREEDVALGTKRVTEKKYGHLRYEEANNYCFWTCWKIKSFWVNNAIYIIIIQTPNHTNWL